MLAFRLAGLVAMRVRRIGRTKHSHYAGGSVTARPPERSASPWQSVVAIASAPLVIARGARNGIAPPQMMGWMMGSADPAKKHR
jgi:hypothetical protein